MESSEGVTVIRMPVNVTALQAPVIFAVPMQLLAYHVAVLKGTDVDQPRNLAKSLTVE
jgi:glucosamine--fructose-6-phosphate aminotransferase (isomerizing)